MSLVAFNKNSVLYFTIISKIIYGFSFIIFVDACNSSFLFQRNVIVDTHCTIIFDTLNKYKI